MKCILLWAIINSFLYRCPSNLETPSCCNCTVVHMGTYDQDVMIMCSEQIETPATTTLAPMGIATTTSTASPPSGRTSTVSSSSTTHSPTTTQIRSTTQSSEDPGSSEDPSNTPQTSTAGSYTSQTTQRPGQNPSDSNRAFTTNGPTNIDKNKMNSSLRSNSVIHHTVIQKSDDPSGIIAIIISSVAIVSLIVFGVWSHKRHEENKRHKMVRPSIEISPTRAQPLVHKQNRNSWAVQQPSRAQTTRPMNKRPSELGRMSPGGWRRLQEELKSVPPRGSGPNAPPEGAPPAIDRNGKPRRAPPSAPSKQSDRAPAVPALDLNHVRRRDGTLMAPRGKHPPNKVQSLANHFESNHTGGAPFPQH